MIFPSVGDWSEAFSYTVPHVTEEGFGFVTQMGLEKRNGDAKKATADYSIGRTYIIGT